MTQLTFPAESICFPRSGHHALLAVLRNYFDNLNYCEGYIDSPSLRLGGSNQTNYQKNHDFGLETPILSDRNYVVQIRHPLDAIASWEQLTRRLGGENTTTASHLEFWTGFVKKWVLSPVPRRIVVCYEDLISRPVPTCTSVIQFLTRVQNIDEGRLYESLQKFPLAQRTVHVPSNYIKA